MMQLSEVYNEFMVLRGLQEKPLYMGTVTYAEKQKRRAKNKVAKASRKRNR